MDTWSPTDNGPFLLQPKSLLALFIHEQLNSFGTIRQRQSERLRLVESIVIADEFGPWSYDHLRGLFELELRSHLTKSFPSAWILDKDARIHCHFVFSGARQDATTTTASLNFDNPRTNSLEQFVQDVCAKEENMKATEWLEALRAEDILSFPHLSNLKQTEWDNIRRLSMNAKRILKAAVDRDRESVSDGRRPTAQASASNGEPPPAAGNQADDSNPGFSL